MKALRPGLKRIRAAPPNIDVFYRSGSEWSLVGWRSQENHRLMNKRDFNRLPRRERQIIQRAGWFANGRLKEISVR